MNFERKVTLYRVITLTIFVLLWELSVQLGAINGFWISSPSKIAVRTYELCIDGEIFRHTFLTLLEAFSGLLAGVVVGFLLGLVLGASRILGKVLEPFVMAINSLPRVALAPLLVMYVGIGFASKFLLAFSLVVVIIMVNTFEGIRSVDQNLVNAMRILGASRVQMFRQVLIPNCVPWILAGLRVSVSFAIVGAIVGEFISSQAGIGYMIDKASGAYDTTGMMVPLLVLMMCAVLIDFLIVQLSNHFLRWRPTKVEED
jgi:NitT/TauT family transport system permease protein